MKERDAAAVVFIFGQSNAHAHAQSLPVDSRITEPMRSVFALDRSPNQSFETESVVWSGFTTAGKNLGETQDHTCSLAYNLAKLWQGAVDFGEALPELYIVQISVGSQGIINGMWNPDREQKLVPGVLGEADISLFPLALRTERLVLRELRERGKRPVVIGWHWMGSEQDIWHGAWERADFIRRYDSFFDALLEPLGECPVYIYKLYDQKFCAQNGIPKRAVDAVNSALGRECERHPGAVMVMAERCPLWEADGEHCGIFAPDNAHYLPEVQRWFAGRFFADALVRLSPVYIKAEFEKCQFNKRGAHDVE